MRNLTVLMAHRGIYYGWAIVAVAFLVNMGHGAMVNPVLSLFIKPLEDEFGWSRGAISASISGAGVLMTLSMLVVGPVIDRFGARVLVVIGSVIGAICLVALSQVSELWQFAFLFMVGRGSMVGSGNVAMGVAVSKWFVRLRGRAIGITDMGHRIGQAVLPLLALATITSLGWRSAFVVLAAPMLVMSAMPALFFLRRSPEDIGLEPDGRSGRGSLLRRNPEASAGVAEPEVSFTLRQAMRTRAFWILTMVTASLPAITGSLNLHLFPYLTDQGISADLAVYSVAIFASMAGIGSIFWGILAERLHVRWCIVLCFSGVAASIGFLLIVHNALLAYGYAVFHGIMVGGTFTLLAIAWANYFGRKSLGAIRGITAPVQAAMSAAGPTFAGVVFDVTGAYTFAFTVFLGLSTFIALSMILAPQPRLRTSAEQS